jgi:hypothetical protein
MWQKSAVGYVLLHCYEVSAPVFPQKGPHQQSGVFGAYYLAVCMAVHAFA